MASKQKVKYARRNLFNQNADSNGSQAGYSEEIKGLGYEAIITLNNPSGATVITEQRRDDNPTGWSTVGAQATQNIVHRMLLQANMRYRWRILSASTSPCTLSLFEAVPSSFEQRPELLTDMFYSDGFPAVELLENAFLASLSKADLLLRWTLTRAQDGYWGINDHCIGSDGRIYYLNPDRGAGNAGNPEVNPTSSQGTTQASWVLVSPESDWSAVEGEFGFIKNKPTISGREIGDWEVSGPTYSSALIAKENILGNRYETDTQNATILLPKTRQDNTPIQNYDFVVINHATNENTANTITLSSQFPQTFDDSNSAKTFPSNMTISITCVYIERDDDDEGEGDWMLIDPYYLANQLDNLDKVAARGSDLNRDIKWLSSAQGPIVRDPSGTFHRIGVNTDGSFYSDRLTG